MIRAAAMLLASLLSARAVAAEVEITVTGVRNAQGRVLVELCPREQFLHLDCPWRAGVPARQGVVTIRLADVPPGVYAAQAFHDENDNRRIDRNFLGIPREGLGFSRDPVFRFGPPSFGDAAFQLGPNGATIALALRYFD